MAEEPMRHRPEQYEETVDPHNPPRSTGAAPAVVAGMWYVLAPIAVMLLVLFVLLLYWFGRDTTPDEGVEPTTGTYEEATPGGVDPDPRYNTPQEEREYRGRDR